MGERPHRRYSPLMALFDPAQVKNALAILQAKKAICLCSNKADTRGKLDVGAAKPLSKCAACRWRDDLWQELDGIQTSLSPGRPSDNLF
ncbi:hypothetical protein SORBI_3008G096150 [Sorghum bicolor]|uniref:Uncharacterized protein n=1 Tax=Sorghum bicolor TaxID=4558 RepID=A0A1Z5R5Q6_SORBI|nr:hypothetical protein SORBI_3008G096150 [Sorghum bicolor]